MYAIQIQIGILVTYTGRSQLFLADDEPRNRVDSSHSARNGRGQQKNARQGRLKLLVEKFAVIIFLSCMITCKSTPFCSSIILNFLKSEQDKPL